MPGCQSFFLKIVGNRIIVSEAPFSTPCRSLFFVNTTFHFCFVLTAFTTTKTTSQLLPEIANDLLHGVLTALQRMMWVFLSSKNISFILKNRSLKGIFVVVLYKNDQV